MKYIGIDIGSSFIKSAVMDLEAAAILDRRKLPSPPRLPHLDANVFEVAAGQYVKLVRELIDGYTAVFPGIGGVVFSTQMHGFVYRTPDREDRYVSWQDMRCLNLRDDGRESHMAYLERMFPAPRRRRSGVPVKPSLGMCNLYAMLSGDARISREGELFTIGSYVIHDLTGNNFCHITNAAPLGLVDVPGHCWDRGMMADLGFEAMRFPEIVESDATPCGVYVSNGQALRVFPDYGDQQTAILGSGAGPEDAVINIGTSSQVSVTVDDFEPGDYEVRPYFGRRYINTISNMPGGRVLDVLIRFLGDAARELTGISVADARIWEVVHAGAAEDSRGIAVDTSFYARPGYLNGGAISGIRPENLSIQTLFAAAYRDMARMYRENIQTLRKDVREYVCAGGVSWKTPELLNAIERQSGKKCRLSAISDESLSGLYQMALLCEGREASGRAAGLLNLT